MEPEERREGVPREPPRGPQWQPEPPDLPGYEVGEAIGRGSTGVVYRARQLAVDREVALKVLHPELARKPRIVARLQREARTTARLAHPHIVAAIDMGQTDGLWWYAMEFVDGPTLATRLKQEGRLTEREALRLFIPLCEALEHAWEHGVVHRDIKPANILIDRARGARLADLGLAFADDDPSLTASGTGTLGTPHYMSPEQARSPGDADVRSDIWSFGATLFHAVCGRAPFTGDSLAEVLSGVLYARLPDPHELEPNLSKGLVLVLRKCLSRDPDARYATPRQLLLDLERVRERRSPQVRRRSLEPLDRGSGAPWGWMAGAVVAAAAAVALLLVWGRGRSPGPESGGPSEFPPLERLEARAAGEPGEVLAPLLGELEELEPEVPEARRGQWLVLRTRLRAHLREELDLLLRTVGREIDGHVAARDFVAARDALGGELERALFERTGFTLAGLPEVQRDFVAARLAYYASGIDSRQAATERHLVQRLERDLEGALLPRVASLRGDGRWHSAQELLELDDGALLARVQFEDLVLPSDDLARCLEPFELVLFGRAQELGTAWRALDRSLAQWVARRASTLEGRLREGLLTAGAADALAVDFAGELAARGLRDDELHPDGLLFARGELDSRRRDLEALEEELRERRLRDTLEEWVALCAPLWSLREYGSIADRFERFLTELDDEPGDRDAAWRNELRRRALLLAREARLLRGILVAAAERVRALDGESTSLVTGNIRRQGTVRLVGDPLVEGFEFVGQSGARERVSLRTQSAAGLEELAGLRAGKRESRTPLERLRLALFRYREGDLEEAGRLAFDVDAPEEGLDGELARELRGRILSGLERRAAAEERRGVRARTLLDVLDRRDPTDPSLPAIAEELLRDFGDVEEVRARRARLRAVRDAAQGPSARPTLEELRRSFGLPETLPNGEPTVERAGRDRARLHFDFTAGAEGTWEPGDWRAEPAGWIGDGESRLAGVGSRSPRLVLRAPLDVERGDLELVLRVEQPWTSGPPKLLVASVAGYHLALAGPGMGEEPRWLLETGGLDELLERVERGEGSEAEALLERGARHELRFVVGRGRSSFEVALDGRTLTRGLVRADASELAPVIAVRSWEPVRLLGAELEADY